MKLKAWEVYMDDGQDAFKLYVPAENKKDVAQYVQGNGEIIAIRECKNPLGPDGEYLIDTAFLMQTLRNAGFGKMERDLIIRTLERATVFARAI